MMIAEHRIRLANVIPASHVKARFVQLLIITQTLDDSKDGGTEKGEENGGQENDTCINESSDWKNRISCIGSKYTRSNSCLSIKSLTLRSISAATEYKPICPAYIEATENAHSGQREHTQW